MIGCQALETLGHQAFRHSTGPQIGRRHTPSPQPAPGHSSCVPPPGLFPPQPPLSSHAGAELTGTGWEVTRDPALAAPAAPPGWSMLLSQIIPYFAATLQMGKWRFGKVM